MKKKQLEKVLKNLGWYKYAEGANHEKWTNGKGEKTTVPRHNEINEITAKSIIKMAQKSPGH